MTPANEHTTSLSALDTAAAAPRQMRIVSVETRVVIALITGFTALRLLSAMFVGLGVDEAYTLAIARQLQLSYFDHPPLHLWLVHLFGGLLGYGRLARLPFIALFAGSSWLLFILTRRLFGPRPGVWAVLALNLSAFFTVVSGSWVLPDGPLIFCLLAATAQIVAILFAVEEQPVARARRPVPHWLGVGLALGLAGLSKYQAVLYALGLTVFLLSTARGRRQLTGPGPYLAALVAAVVVSPVLIWNAQHHWASFVFQGGRAMASHSIRPTSALSAVLGQIALLLPWIFGPLALAGWRAARIGPPDARRWICLCLGLPAVLLFTLTPIWGQTALPHWSMPGWLMLFPLLGDGLARAASDRRWPRIWAWVSSAVLLTLWTFVTVSAATGWIGRTWPRTFVKGDPTLETVEWTPLREALADVAILKEPKPFVVAMKWNEAGRIVPVVSDQTPVAVFSDDPRGLGYDRGIESLVGRDAVIVVKPEDLDDGLVRITPCFASVEPVKAARFGRLGYPELELHVFAGHQLRPACSELGQPSAAALVQWRALKARQAAAR